jgi:hypothetical protein
MDLVVTYDALLSAQLGAFCPVDVGFWSDGRQSFRYARERPMAGRVRVARQPGATR